MKNESKVATKLWECKYTIVGFQDEQQINVINHPTQTKCYQVRRTWIVLSLLAKRILTQRTLKTKYSLEFHLREKIRTPIVRYAEGNDGTINFKLRKELPFPTLPYCAIMELAELQFCEMQSLAAYECITENARDKRLYRESWIATSSAKLAITFAEVSSGTGDSGYLNYEIDDLLNLASGVLQLNKNKLALAT
ncbi:hypothetical protein HZH66_008180 [Vespula vulgaris]|uniref:Uncharacterized protein n=1 Tax=Vespula vulgaris TaxID=7454 RepID=A0A834JWM3_VESVU|nr:hypothetical protein HZH66_008180 [Vespula vulgaris]